MKLKFSNIILFVSLVLSLSTKAYVHNRTSGDLVVKWASSVSLVEIFLNSTNPHGLDEMKIRDITSSSIDQWNNNSLINIRLGSSIYPGQEGLNEIYFSDEASIFNGSSVVGVTNVTYKNNTGEILEADILINQAHVFETDDKLSQYYLGNVITHELGHLLGLGHSQVIGSSMFYALSKGQSDVSADDMAGVYSIYPTNVSVKGSISGKIVGGKSRIGVFGAQVQAISLDKGEIVAANFSDVDGTFKIDGLNKNEKYYLYVKPLVKVGLPARFDKARTNFCDSGSSYRGSFYQSCGSSNEGYPQSVNLIQNNLDVGAITIRCGVDSPLEYLLNKNEASANFDLISKNNGTGVGNAFVGVFSSQELDKNIDDYFRINLSHITNWDQYSLENNIFLQVNIINQQFYSPFKAAVTVIREQIENVIQPQVKVQNDGWSDIDSKILLPIDKNNYQANDIEFKISPKKMDLFNFPLALPGSKEDYFPVYSRFEDTLLHYLVTARIVKKLPNGQLVEVSSKTTVARDNLECTDANQTYPVSLYTSSGGNKDENKRSSGVACGSIDVSGGPGNGAGGLFIGLIMSLFISKIFSYLGTQYKSKHYSKLA